MHHGTYVVFGKWGSGSVRSRVLSTLGWLVLSLYFATMLGVGFVARFRIKTASDFFTAGGAMPWWLSGISHHMSGYSSVVFVGYAALAYTVGISVYIWWACSICLALLIGSRLFAPRWARMRQHLHVVSPLEYLVIRYDLPTQQLLGWSGTLLKIFDVATKWTASAILLKTFAAISIPWGVLLIGSITLVYSVMGGLWADALTDLSQFVIQLVAGLAMLVATLHRLGGVRALWLIWKVLPPGHTRPFQGDYNLVFACAFFFVNLLSYNGGMWSLAQRFIAASTGENARKSALLSALLYLVWPPILFFPMWAAPIIFPHLQDPSESYARLTGALLPSGLIGLVVAGLFAHTMAVIVRDIIPVLRKDKAANDDRTQLLLGRVVTFCFLLLSMGLAIVASHLGGIVSLVVLWFGALIGPTALPMLLGMLMPFRRSGPAAAIACWFTGALTFGVLKFFPPERWLGSRHQFANAVMVGAPLAVAFLTYVGVGLCAPWREPASQAFLLALEADAAPLPKD